MWNTSQGMRTLAGPEATPILAALDWLVDHIHDEWSGDDTRFETSVQLFDDLSWTQQLSLLDEVATGLLTPDSSKPALTALHDAAVAAIFNTIEILLIAEVQMRDVIDWRRMVRESYRSCCPAETSDVEYLPTTLGDEREDRWSFVVQLLTDRVLYDRDFEVADSVLDLDPEQAENLRHLLGINADYYAAASSDVTEDQAGTLIGRIRELTSHAN